MKTVQHLRSSESGAVAIEFAFVGLFVLVLCIGTVEFGRALYLASELSYAADRGTRLVLMNPQVSDAALAAEVRAHLRLANTNGLEVLTRSTVVDSQITRSLSVSLPVSLLIPTYSLPAFRLEIERKVPIS